MGDEFIKKKSKSYRRQAEKVHAEEFNQRGVFAVAPTRTSYVVRFTAPGVDVHVSEELFLADIPGKPGIRVMLGTTTIGEVDAVGSAKIRELLAENPSAGGVLPGIVVAAKDVAGYAKAQVSL